MEASERPPGYICTFYSYKGGVGRSMALANIAVLLARMNRKVLVVDWDLEAPGLEKYLDPVLQKSARTTPGLIDLVFAYSKGERSDWRKGLLTGKLAQSGRIDLLHAGLDDRSYLEKLRTINWEALFQDRRLGDYLEQIRQEWRSEYDLVLIDSRTGITDIGGICSILMPDCLVCFFTTNLQSLVGVKDTMLLARRAHAGLPLERNRLAVVPIPARDESNTEYKLAAEWRERFAKELGEFYVDWIPKGETPARVLDYLKIPYVAFWSFGEALPVLHERDDNPKSLAYSYGIIARLLESKLTWSAATVVAVEETEAVRREKAEKEAAQRALGEAKEEQRRVYEDLKAYFLWRVQQRLRAYQVAIVASWIGVGVFGLFAVAMLGAAIFERPAEPAVYYVVAGVVAFWALLGGLCWRSLRRLWSKRDQLGEVVAKVTAIPNDTDPSQGKEIIRDLDSRVFDWSREGIFVATIEGILSVRTPPTRR
jgi:cellulose biosynthesis protein BcsQ